MMAIKYMTGDIDHTYEGPQVVDHGCVHEVVVTIAVPENATPEQIEEYISHELGAGSIGPDNPLYDGSSSVKEVEHSRDTGRHLMTLWEAHGEREPGRRFGSSVMCTKGEPLNAEYVERNQ